MKTNKILKTLKNFMLIISSATVCGGCAIGIINAVNNTTQTISSSTTLNNKRSIGKYAHDISSGANVTDARIDDYVNAVADKLQLELKSVWTKDADIKKLVGTFKTNVKSFRIQKQQKQGNTLTPDTNSEILNYAKQESKKLGVNIADFNDFKNQTIPQVAQTLLKNGESQQFVADVTNEMLDVILPNAEANYYSDVDLGLAIANDQSIQASAKNECLRMNHAYGDQQDIAKQAQLKAVLSYTESILNDKLTTKSEGTFVGFMKDYAADGKYDVGSEVDENDLQYLFDYQYDKTVGADFSEYSLDDIPTIDVTLGQYDQDVLGRITINQPFTNLEDAASSYGIADILPGYQVHVKIDGKDVTSDSHYCKLSLQLGVATDNDPKNVLWSDTNQQTQDDNISVNLKVSKAEHYDYIAQHTYYPGYQFVINDSATVPNEQGLWFDTTASQRTLLDQILSTAYVDSSTGDYDLQNHPLILNPHDYTDIPKPTFDSQQHTNQELALVATDVNTNKDKDSLTTSWAYVDRNATIYNSVDDTYSTQDIVVKRIPWIINGTNYDSINIAYNIDPTIGNEIASGTLDADLIDAFGTAQQFYANYNLPENSNTRNKVNDFTTADLILSDSQAIAATAVATCSIALGVMAICTVSVKTALDAAMAAAAAAMDGYYAYEVVKQAYDCSVRKDRFDYEDNLFKTKENSDATSHAYNLMSNDQEYKDKYNRCNLKDLINDPRLNLNDKVNVAKKLHAIRAQMFVSAPTLMDFEFTKGIDYTNIWNDGTANKIKEYIFSDNKVLDFTNDSGKATAVHMTTWVGYLAANVCAIVTTSWYVNWKVNKLVNALREINNANDVAIGPMRAEVRHLTEAGAAADDGTRQGQRLAQVTGDIAGIEADTTANAARIRIYEANVVAFNASCVTQGLIVCTVVGTIIGMGASLAQLVMDSWFE